MAERLKINARVVTYAPPQLVLSGSRPWSTDALRDLHAVLKDATGATWRVTLDDAPGAPTLREAEREADEAARQAILASPMVAAARQAFPDADLEWPMQRSAS